MPEALEVNDHAKERAGSRESERGPSGLALAPRAENKA
jgi:hypothetical protein